VLVPPVCLLSSIHDPSPPSLPPAPSSRGKKTEERKKIEKAERLRETGNIGRGGAHVDVSFSAMGKEHTIFSRAGSAKQKPRDRATGKAQQNAQGPHNLGGSR